MQLIIILSLVSHESYKAINACIVFIPTKHVNMQLIVYIRNIFRSNRILHLIQSKLIKMYFDCIINFLLYGKQGWNDGIGKAKIAYACLLPIQVWSKIKKCTSWCSWKKFFYMEFMYYNWIKHQALFILSEICISLDYRFLDGVWNIFDFEIIIDCEAAWIDEILWLFFCHIWTECIPLLVSRRAISFCFVLISCLMFYVLSHIS